jgi:hypothetical protein
MSSRAYGVPSFVLPHSQRVAPAADWKGNGDKESSYSFSNTSVLTEKKKTHGWNFHIRHDVSADRSPEEVFTQRSPRNWSLRFARFCSQFPSDKTEDPRKFLHSTFANKDRRGHGPTSSLGSTAFRPRCPRRLLQVGDVPPVHTKPLPQDNISKGRRPRVFITTDSSGQRGDHFSNVSLDSTADPPFPRRW